MAPGGLGKSRPSFWCPVRTYPFQTQKQGILKNLRRGAYPPESPSLWGLRVRVSDYLRDMSSRSFINIDLEKLSSCFCKILTCAKFPALVCNLRWSNLASSKSRRIIRRIAPNDFLDFKYRKSSIKPPPPPPSPFSIKRPSLKSHNFRISPPSLSKSLNLLQIWLTYFIP